MKNFAIHKKLDYMIIALMNQTIEI